MYSCYDRGPAFGDGHDIYIASYASSNTNSYSQLGHTYSPPSGHSYRSSFAQSFLAGSLNFQPDEVEVFYETTWSKRVKSSVIISIKKPQWFKNSKKLIQKLEWLILGMFPLLCNVDLEQTEWKIIEAIKELKKALVKMLIRIGGN